MNSLNTVKLARDNNWILGLTLEAYSDLQLTIIWANKPPLHLSKFEFSFLLIAA